jgi:triosephosphate isomerase
MPEQTQRQKFICGNWKMNGTLEETRSLLQGLVSQWQSAFDEVEVAVCPPFTALMESARLLQGTAIQLGAQNAYFEDQGAFTGEVSLRMIGELGASYVILGHSERRILFGETDALINKKIDRAIATGLMPILCVGETLEERERGAAEAVITKQLEESLTDLTIRQFSRVTIAYEPVWAIGTGKTATSQQAQKAHSVIRERINTLFGRESGQTVRILYGGSLKPENALELLSLPDVDGGLIGGAALKADTFMAIVQAAAEITSRAQS